MKLFDWIFRIKRKPTSLSRILARAEYDDKGRLSIICPGLSEKHS